MSKEVSGQPEGVTLLECINTGVVPYTERMPYVRWLEWRKETGSRPVKRRDGRSTSTADEVALWRSVMDFLYDVKEEDEEEEEEEEDDEDESRPREEPVDDIDGPELIPEAGDGLGEAAALEQAAARAAAAAPTAGATGLAAAGDSALAVVPCPLTVGRGFRVRPRRRGPCLLRLSPYRPTCGRCSARTKSRSRIILRAFRASSWRFARTALRSRRRSSTGSRRTSLLAEEFGQVGGDWHPTRMVRRLRARFTAAALKEGDDGDDADVQKEIQAIGELILALGGKPGAAARAWRSVATSQSRSGSRSSGRGAARSGQAGSKARRRAG